MATIAGERVYQALELIDGDSAITVAIKLAEQIGELVKGRWLGAS